jgi:PadR family transcriptional regulator PadR
MGQANQELIPDRLDLLILRTLARGTMPSNGIAQQLKTISDDVLKIGESSLYSALQRLLLKGRVVA